MYERLKPVAVISEKEKIVPDQEKPELVVRQPILAMQRTSRLRLEIRCIAKIGWRTRNSGFSWSGTKSSIDGDIVSTRLGFRFSGSHEFVAV